MAKEIRNENAEAVVEAVSKTEKFFNENGKLFGGVLAGLVVVALAAFCWFKFAYQPAVAEAEGQMALAEQNFRAADYELALNGDGNVLGFAQIIDEYGAKAGKAAQFYAGVCELQLGNYEEAVSYLKAYKGKDAILKARALACIADCHVELGNYEKAYENYVAALNTADNDLAAEYAFRAGLVAEKLGNKADALAMYNTVKENYPSSPRANEILKYISRAEAK